MSKQAQLQEAVEMIKEVLGIGDPTVDSLNEMTSEQSKELQNAFVEKFGCTKQTAYYYYMYRGKKALEAAGFKIVMAARVNMKPVRKSAKSETEDAIAKLQKSNIPASPFRL
tara:strand:- start:26 stop:361 length:336 start_codon:yes stop_codon:yes gene_type:complete